MSKNVVASGMVVVVLWSAASIAAPQLGTADEARAMLDRAISALKTNEDTALNQFNDPSNKQFREHDLYVFCYNMSDGKITAYESPALLNVDLRTLSLKDDPIGQRTYDAVQNAPDGTVVTVDYNLPKPGTTVPVPKQTIVARVGEQSCGVTYFK